MIKEYNESVRWMERRYSICSFCCAFFGHQFLFSCNVSVFVRMAVKKRRIYFMDHISFYSYRIYLLQAILRFLSSENFSTFTLFLLRHALVFLWIDCHIESEEECHTHIKHMWTMKWEGIELVPYSRLKHWGYRQFRTF